MPRSLRFLIVLLVGLTARSLAAVFAVQGPMRAWFAHDLSLRVRLAVSGARKTLTERWSEPTALGELLAELARDERLLAVAACDEGRRIVAKTDGYPEGLGCIGEEPHFLRLRGAELHVSAIPLQVGTPSQGSISMVHDPRYVTERIKKYAALPAPCVRSANAVGCDLYDHRHAAYLE